MIKKYNNFIKEEKKFQGLPGPENPKCSFVDIDKKDITTYARIFKKLTDDKLITLVDNRAWYFKGDIDTKSILTDDEHQALGHDEENESVKVNEVVWMKGDKYKKGTKPAADKNEITAKGILADLAKKMGVSKEEVMKKLEEFSKKINKTNEEFSIEDKMVKVEDGKWGKSFSANICFELKGYLQKGDGRSEIPMEEAKDIIMGNLDRLSGSNDGSELLANIQEDQIRIGSSAYGESKINEEFTEADTSSENYIICPYCQTEQEDHPENIMSGGGGLGDEFAECTCDTCDENFDCSKVVEIKYYTRKK